MAARLTLEVWEDGIGKGPKIRNLQKYSVEIINYSNLGSALVESQNQLRLIIDEILARNNHSIIPLVQPINSNSCGQCCVAMIAGVPVEKVFKIVGHDSATTTSATGQWILKE